MFLWTERGGRYTSREFFFLIRTIADTTLQDVVREQYHLARKANISLTESSMLPEFEREAYTNMLIKDLKDEAEQMKFK